MKILVVGGAKTVYFLARAFLSKGHEVVVVNRDEGECRWLARRLNATIVRGDGSDPAILEDAGALGCDAVLAVTPNDHDNFVICRLADRHFQVPMTLAVVSDPDNEQVFSQLGVKSVVSVTRLVTTLIEERAGFEEVMSFTSVGEGRVNITEIVLTEDSPFAGMTLREAPLPADSLIACVVRGGEAIIPHGDTRVSVGDRVVLVTLPGSHGPAVKAITGEP
jgi:trk system potassium uptake protein TrkA